MSTRRYTVSIDDRSFTIDVFETAADRFVVSVDGQSFEATLDGDRDLPGGPISPGVSGPASPARPADVQPPRVTQASTGAAAPGPSARASSSRPSASDVLAAPMPGVILEVLVTAGDQLRHGDPVLVLEAMKMRNTIRSPREGLVIEVAVTAGQPVGPGDLLVRLGAGSP